MSSAASGNYIIVATKTEKLKQIGQLRMTLEEEGADVTSFILATQESSMHEIDSVLTRLRLKIEQNHRDGRPTEPVVSTPTFAEQCWVDIEKVQADDDRISKILASREETVAYLAQALWDKYVTRRLKTFIVDRARPIIEGELYTMMQSALRGDRVYIRSGRMRSFPEKEIAEKLVAKAISEGLVAETYTRMRYPEGDASPDSRRFVDIRLPARPTIMSNPPSAASPAPSAAAPYS